MKIISPAFSNNEEIPSKYTCDSDNVNPPLEVADFPSETKTLVLIMDDPDAPSKTWVHWVILNINVDGLDKVEIKESSSPGTDGVNDFGSLGYGGPCPPSGVHRYFFKVFALDAELDLKQGTTKEELEKAMQGHVIDNAELVGLYERR